MEITLTFVTGVLMTNDVIDRRSTIINEEKCLPYSRVILQHWLLNYIKIMKKCFLGTTSTAKKNATHTVPSFSYFIDKVNLTIFQNVKFLYGYHIESTSSVLTLCLRHQLGIDTMLSAPAIYSNYSK